VKLNLSILGCGVLLKKQKQKNKSDGENAMLNQGVTIDSSLHAMG